MILEFFPNQNLKINVIFLPSGNKTFIVFIHINKINEIT